MIFPRIYWAFDDRYPHPLCFTSFTSQIVLCEADGDNEDGLLVSGSHLSGDFCIVFHLTLQALKISGVSQLTNNPGHGNAGHRS